jgi:hypothetical protein
VVARRSAVYGRSSNLNSKDWQRRRVRYNVVLGRFDSIRVGKSSLSGGEDEARRTTQPTRGRPFRVDKAQALVDEDVRDDSLCWLSFCLCRSKPWLWLFSRKIEVEETGLRRAAKDSSINWTYLEKTEVG